MKKILTNNIVTPVKQPFTRTSLEYIQDAYTTSLDYISNAPSIIKPAYLNGVFPQIIFGNNLNYAFGYYSTDIGAIKFNGNIYYSPGSFFSTTGVPVVYIVTEYASTDPVQLSDGSSANVHQNKTIIITGGTAGIGGADNASLEYLCDYSELLQVPTINDVYPTAVIQSDIINMAEKGQIIKTNVSLTGTSVYTPDEVLVSSIDQFDKFEYHGIFRVTNGTTPAAGWNLLTSIPANAMPKNITENYYLSCVRYWGITDVEVVALLITPSRNMYYYNPSSAVVSEAHVHLNYSV
jgi:hypothetical protein